MGKEGYKFFKQTVHTIFPSLGVSSHCLFADGPNSSNKLTICCHSASGTRSVAQSMLRSQENQALCCWPLPCQKHVSPTSEPRTPLTFQPADLELLLVWPSDVGRSEHGAGLQLPAAPGGRLPGSLPPLQRDREIMEWYGLQSSCLSKCRNVAHERSWSSLERHRSLPQILTGLGQGENIPVCC